MMPFGGFLASRFGAHGVLFTGALIAFLCTTLSPAAALLNPYLLATVEAFKGLATVSSRDLLFSVETVHSQRTPDILHHPSWLEDSTTDLHLSHLYLLLTLIIVMLICFKNKLFDSFHNDNSYIQPYLNRTKTFITGRNEVVAKVMFLLMCVILFMGGSASVHGGIPSPGADPPEADPPPEQTPTPAYGQWAAGTHTTGMHSCFE